MELKTGYPYWLIKNGLPYQYPKLAKNIKADVAIIGGGISGALAAYHLTNSGLSCVLLDRRTIGLGSTCASTSFIQYELDKPLCDLTEQIGREKAEGAYMACLQSIDILTGIAKKIKYKEIESVPSLFYAAEKSDSALIKKEFAARKKAGIDVKLLSKEEVKKAYGINAPAILSAKGCTVDAYMLCHALNRYALDKGLQIFDRTTVIKTEEGKSGVKLHTEDGFTVSCKKVINATGYESVNFMDEKIVRLISTYAIISENIDDPKDIWKDRAMIWNTADPYLYMRLTKDNRIMVGGRDEKIFNPEARNKLIKTKSTLLANDFKKLFPKIKFVPEFSWAGTFGITKDSLPYIGSIKKHPNIYYTLGFGGNGITFSLIAAEIITDLIHGKKNKNAELFAFDRIKG
jgi:glycine/D-amino acid oxidase-like deaminating enzyme